MQDELTTLVCLFHHEEQAEAAVRDLRDAGIPENAISIIGGDGAGVDALDKSELSGLGMPDRDYDHLKAGIRNANVVIAVRSIADHVAAVERIFQKHRAEKIDEADSTRKAPEPVLAAAPVAAAAPLLSEAAVPAANTSAVVDEAVIPVVEEDLLVGKRTVDQGGVRLYRRVIEIPVEESVDLREEHVSVDRVPVDRLIADTDDAFQNRTIELTETAEEAVVSKDARVVEEIVLSKGVTEHTETVRDTVRHTEVEVEELPGAETAGNGTAGRGTVGRGTSGTANPEGLSRRNDG